MTLIRFTLDELVAWNPCWSLTRIKALSGERTEFTLREVLLHSGISGVDKVWLSCRTLPPREARLFAADCACRSLTHERKVGREPDPRSWRAVEVARDHALGKASDEDLACAHAADAADAAASASAYAAAAAAAAASDSSSAYAAAAAAAYAADAASAAAAAAAYAASAAAASRAAYDAECAEQVKRLLGLLDWSERQ